jgi:hypothetical protein
MQNKTQNESCVEIKKNKRMDEALIDNIIAQNC